MTSLKNKNYSYGVDGSLSEIFIFDEGEYPFIDKVFSFFSKKSEEELKRERSEEFFIFDRNRIRELMNYTYDSDNSSENVYSSYGYDGLGNRIFKGSSNSAHGYSLVYEGIRVVADLHKGSQYIYVSQSHSPDFMIRNNKRYKFIKDQVGSVLFVVEAGNGQIHQTIEYDEFGNVLSDSNPGFQPFYFAGGIYDLDNNWGKVKIGWSF